MHIVYAYSFDTIVTVKLCMCLFTVASPRRSCTCLITLLHVFLITTGKPLTFSSAYRAVLHCTHWEELGILLNVDYNTLKEISLNREGPSACKAAMLKAWLKGNANASWRQLADALKDMGEILLVHELEEQILHSTNIDGMLLIHVF